MAPGSWSAGNPVCSYLRHDLSAIPADARIGDTSLRRYTLSGNGGAHARPVRHQEPRHRPAPHERQLVLLAAYARFRLRELGDSSSVDKG
jgi:hypothetical protein